MLNVCATSQSRVGVVKVTAGVVGASDDPRGSDQTAVCWGKLMLILLSTAAAAPWMDSRQ